MNSECQDLILKCAEIIKRLSLEKATLELLLSGDVLEVKSFIVKLRFSNGNRVGETTMASLSFPWDVYVSAQRDLVASLEGELDNLSKQMRVVS